MQQGSVGDGDSAPRNSPKNSNAGVADGRVRVKVEAPESTELFDVKRETQDEYHAVQHDYHYQDRKPIVPTKFDANSEIINQCQPPHQGYPRPVNSGLPNSYGFSHFYGPAMLPPSFHGARPSPDRPIGKIDEHEHEQERYKVPVSGDSVFMHHDPHRYEIGDYHGKGYPGMAYPAFRPSMQQRAPMYTGHHNNSSYRTAQYQNRKRKWSGAALRGMPPSMPVSPTFFSALLFLSLRIDLIYKRFTKLYNIFYINIYYYELNSFINYNHRILFLTWKWFIELLLKIFKVVNLYSEGIRIRITLSIQFLLIN